MLDPPRSHSVPPATLEARWEGKALLVSPNPLASEESLVPADLTLWYAAGAAALLAAIGLIVVRRRRAVVLLLPALALPVAGCGHETGQIETVETNVSAAAPVAALEDADRDLGVLRLTGERREHVEPFTLRNDGDAPLRVLSISTSCTCTGATVDDATVPPGGSTVLRVAATAKRAGSSGASVTVATNDPATPRLKAAVVWDAQAPRAVTPDFLDFGIVRPGETLTRDLTLSAHPDAGEVGEVTGMTTAPPAVNADRDGDRVRVLFTAPDEPGPGRGWVKVWLAGTFTDQLRVPCRWTVRDRVAVVPPRAFLGVVAPGEAVTGTVRITAYGEPVRVAAVEPAGDDVGDGWAVDAAPDGGGGDSGEVVLRFSGSAPERSGRHDGTVEVTLAAPERRTVSVPYSVLVRDGGAS